LELAFQMLFFVKLINYSVRDHINRSNIYFLTCLVDV
jgi:hypothetical protein